MTTEFDTTPGGAEPTARPTERTPARAPRVLFAAYPGGRPSGALLRAHAFARIFGGELTVLRVLPSGVPSNMLFPHLNLRCALIELGRFTKAIRRTRALSDSTLPEPLPEGRVLVRDGDFDATVARVALEIGADLIVLPPAEGRSGLRVTTLSAKTGAPVLVAREAKSCDVVVAATDLADDRYPVLSRAAEIAARLGTSVVLVHNISTREIDDAHEGGIPARWIALAGEIERRRRKLLRLGEAMAADFEPVVANRQNAAEAIIDAARERDADLIVVGMRAAVNVQGQVVAGTAAAVVESTRRSILVLPFAEALAA